MRCQSGGNHDDHLQHQSKRFRRCCGVKYRCLKGCCERNFTSVKYLEIVKSITGTVKQVASLHLEATIASSTFTQLCLYITGDDTLFGINTQFHLFRQLHHVRSHSVECKVFENIVMASFDFVIEIKTDESEIKR
ncbi:hypothetical protein TNCV_3442161 [Trichonephila clavipes]|nr:hypothetical protein TNCV_3442161 [Trichonephila clavipes]